MKADFQRWLRFMVENMFINRDYEVCGRRRLFLRRPKPYKGPAMRECPDCRGDGKLTCHNPDHGLIDALSFHDIGRIGCPGCGHEENRKVRNGGPCDTCNGKGKVIKDIAEKYLKENNNPNEDLGF